MPVVVYLFNPLRKKGSKGARTVLYGSAELYRGSNRSLSAITFVILYLQAGDTYTDT